MHIMLTLASKVYKEYPHWDVWLLKDLGCTWPNVGEDSRIRALRIIRVWGLRFRTTRPDCHGSSSDLAWTFDP